MGPVTLPLTNDTVPQWDDYIASHPDSTFYHQTSWKRVIEDVYHLEQRYLICSEGEQAVGVVPLFSMRNLSFKKVMVSLPFSNYGGILCNSPHIGDILISSIGKIVVNEHFSYAQLKVSDEKLCGPNMPMNTQYCSPTITLPENSHELFEMFDGKARNQIRKGEKNGLYAVSGNDDGLKNQFTTLYWRKMKDHGTPAHGRAWFDAISRYLAKDHVYVIVYAKKRPIAGLLIFYHKSRAILQYAVSLSETNSLCPNNVGYWHAIQNAISRGMTKFDFGRSRLGSGTHHFKMQWSAVSIGTPYCFVGLANKPIPFEDPAMRKYAMIAAVWRHLPDAVVQKAGPTIRRYITT